MGRFVLYRAADRQDIQHMINGLLSSDQGDVRFPSEMNWTPSPELRDHEVARGWKQDGWQLWESGDRSLVLFTKEDTPDTGQGAGIQLSGSDLGMVIEALEDLERNDSGEVPPDARRSEVLDKLQNPSGQAEPPCLGALKAELAYCRRQIALRDQNRVDLRDLYWQKWTELRGQWNPLRNITDDRTLKFMMDWEAWMRGSRATEEVTSGRPNPGSLYDRDYRYTGAALELEGSCYGALSAAMIRYVGAGYSPREISKVLQDVVRDLELEAMLGLDPVIPKKEAKS
ncbi:MAG: hypothetical protein M0P73_16245 [Syntrophobacterales bacterium]|jgi:hypothetical protein|nr:hypothetical protein [Syntrophobacterales bacterium]